MKRILLIGLPLLLALGGAAGAMFYFKIPPFKKPPAKPKKTAAAANHAPPAAASVPVIPSQPVARDPGRSTTPRSRPKTSAPTAGDVAVEEQDEARITRLSSVYEQMPAEDAGRIFAKLPDPLVEKLLRRMDERQVGKLLLALDVDRAARLTQSLAK